MDPKVCRVYSVCVCEREREEEGGSISLLWGTVI